VQVCWGLATPIPGRPTGILERIHYREPDQASAEVGGALFFASERPLATHCGHSETVGLCVLAWTTLRHPATASAGLMPRRAGAPAVVEQLLKSADGRQRHQMKS
jgi:hypothetical protein